MSAWENAVVQVNVHKILSGIMLARRRGILLGERYFCSKKQEIGRKAWISSMCTNTQREGVKRNQAFFNGVWWQPRGSGDKLGHKTVPSEHQEIFIYCAVDGVLAQVAQRGKVSLFENLQNASEHGPGQPALDVTAWAEVGSSDLQRSFPA